MEKALSIIFFILCFISCTPSQNTRVKNYYAVQKYKLKNYDESTHIFLQAKNSATNLAEKNIISYNIALSYKKSYELENALKVFLNIKPNKNIELNYLVPFQIGCIYFRLNEAATALEYFKKSLIAKPSFMEAKINYEFCLKIITEENKASKESNTLNKIDSLNEKAILDFIKEKELQIWELQKDSTSNHSQAYDY